MRATKSSLSMTSLLASIALFSCAAAASAAQDPYPAPAPAPARGLPDNQLAPLSLDMLKLANDSLAVRNTADAISYFEAALAADPRNRQAYVGLARAAQAEGLPGRAIRYYREALELEPNDTNALELQGVALVERGAKARAEENLQRLKTICADPCPAADRLAAIIANKAPVASPAATTSNASDPAPEPASEAAASEAPDE